MKKAETLVVKESLPRPITGLERRVLRGLLRLLFLLRYQRRHARLCLEKVGKLRLLITPQVFNPNLFGSSRFLVEYLQKYPLPPNSRVLDLGCGSGILGISLAGRGVEVIATDINPEAVWLAAVNARLNGCDAQYQTRQGSLYEPVTHEAEKFDLIVINPPYYPHSPKSPLEQAFMAGPDLEVLRGMLVGVAEHVKEDGCALVVVSSTIALAPCLEEAKRAGLSWELVAKRRYWAEWLLIYQFQLAVRRAVRQADIHA